MFNPKEILEVTTDAQTLGGGNGGGNGHIRCLSAVPADLEALLNELALEAQEKDAE